MKVGAGKASGKSPVMAIVIAVLVVLAIGLGAGWYFVWSVTPPKVVAQTFMDAATKDDWESMAKCIAAKDKTLFETEKAQHSSRQSNPNPANALTCKCGGTTYENGTAKVALTVTLPSRMGAILGVSEVQSNCLLLREGRAWKVDFVATEQAQKDALMPLIRKAMESRAAVGAQGAPGTAPSGY